MKYSLLVVALLFTSLLSAQKKSTAINSKAFKIQGAYFFEGHPVENYMGFNLVNLGFMKVKDRKVIGLDLEGRFIESTVDKNKQQTSPRLPFCVVNKRSLEFSAYKTYGVLGSFKNGLYVGPMLSLGFLREEQEPDVSLLAFPDNKSLLKLGAGVKADYYISLSQKLFFTVGTRLTLLDFGFLQGRVENPTLPILEQKYSGFEFEFVRPQFPLMLGLVFLLGK